MKALTVKQPWARLIFLGKNVENRSWKTNYRGKLLVHAGKAFDYDALLFLHKHDAVNLLRSMLVHFKVKFDLVNCQPIGHDDKECGAIIGSVDVVDCVENSKSRWAQPGVFHWILENPVEFQKPIPCKGAQGLWNTPKEVIESIKWRW